MLHLGRRKFSSLSMDFNGMKVEGALVTHKLKLKTDRQLKEEVEYWLWLESMIASGLLPRYCIAAADTTARIRSMCRSFGYFT